jgi:hypothetical protein
MKANFGGNFLSHDVGLRNRPVRGTLERQQSRIRGAYQLRWHPVTRTIAMYFLFLAAKYGISRDGGGGGSCCRDYPALDISRSFDRLPVFEFQATLIIRGESIIGLGPRRRHSRPSPHHHRYLNFWPFFAPPYVPPTGICPFRAFQSVIDKFLHPIFRSHLDSPSHFHSWRLAPILVY